LEEPEAWWRDSEASHSTRFEPPLVARSMICVDRLSLCCTYVAACQERYSVADAVLGQESLTMMKGVRSTNCIATFQRRLSCCKRQEGGKKRGNLHVERPFGIRNSDVGIHFTRLPPSASRKDARFPSAVAEPLPSAPPLPDLRTRSLAKGTQKHMQTPIFTTSTTEHSDVSFALSCIAATISDLHASASA
jgi:hypothetical protein